MPVPTVRASDIVAIAEIHAHTAVAIASCAEYK
jgi:hypothetical protein